MSIKALISVLVYLNVHLISAAPDSLRSSQDDATQAFGDLQTFNGHSMNAVLSNISQAIKVATLVIDKSVNDISTDTQSKVNQTKSTILQSLQTLNDFGLDSSVCRGTVFDQLDEFNDEIRDRVTACGSMATEMLDQWFQRIQRVEIEQVLTSSVLSCHFRDLSQCNAYAMDDSCYDAVIDGIEKAKSSLSLNYQIMTTAFLTKIADYKLPCQDLLNYEVSHFLSSRLKVVRNCIQVQLKLAQQSICNLS